MDHENDHHEEFYSPTTATYIELLSAAGLVASAARGEQEQRRTPYPLDNAHAPHSKTPNHLQRSATQNKPHQQESLSVSHQTTLALGPPLKQTRLEVITDSHTMRDFSDYLFFDSPETPRAPITPDALTTTSSATYFDSVPIHMSTPSIPSASHISTSDPFAPSNVASQSQSRNFPNHAHPPTILKLARRLAQSPSQTSQLSNQELEAVEVQFSWLEDTMSEDDEDPFALDRQFNPKQVEGRAREGTNVDPDDTPRLRLTARTPLPSLQTTPRRNATQRVTNRSLSFDQRRPSRSPARLRSLGPPPDLPLPSIPLFTTSLPPQPVPPHTPSRTHSRSRSILQKPPVPPLPVGLGLGLPTKALPGSRSPGHVLTEGTVTANSVFRNRSHTSGVDQLPSQTKEDVAFLVEEHHTIQASRVRAASGGSGMSRGLMHNQRAEFRKKAAAIPVLRYDIDTGRRESDDASVSSATGSEAELLRGERDETLKGRKGRTRMW